MDNTWLIYTGITVFYIAILVIYFWRRSRKHEQQLVAFLEHAKKQLAEHQKRVHNETEERLDKAFALIRRLQHVAENLENQAQDEYDQIVEDAKEEKKAILKQAREQSQEILTSADQELEDYREKRQHQIEGEMVKLVISVSEKVVEKSLTRADQVDLIQRAVNEIKEEKQKL